jgi:DNA-binding transcriptional LysR family regulator
VQNDGVYDWNDLKHFLAAARTGSTLGAAKALGVNQTTCARRIAALEEALGADLFDRKREGYKLTEAGTALVPLAERVEAATVAISDHLSANARLISGTIKITTNESDADALLMPAIAAFRMQYPDVRIEMVVDVNRLDLVRGEADMALRAASRPSEPGLVARRLPDEHWTVYCTKAYADRYGMPDSMEALRGHAIFSFGDPIGRSPAAIWAAGYYDPDRIVSTMNNVNNMIAAIRSGVGVGIVPMSLAALQPDFIRCFDPPREFDSERWLVTTEELRNVPRIRAFMDFLAEHIHARKRELKH